MSVSDPYANYWESRKRMKYYAYIQSILKDTRGDIILDVGGQDTPMALQGDFKRRLVVDIKLPTHPLPGVEYYAADFLKWEPVKADVVLCLQVLEHLADDVVVDFTQKLFDVAQRQVIISVPYKWPVESCKYHKQDPADTAKLRSWTRRNPSIARVITDDNCQRLICVYNLDQD